ncbi:polyphosphate polymerase domain-containing protein [Sporosarcina jeotgali]|uniref:Polyphosphate polymerase domain-containing protein n=1 Tax=Sporosarcina jeotgali TaxID=3020056 RepID=A0ABZ0L2L5_9BACL|nr:polyphosphate polymerase domain-containing protein [Sporosarcina sp. B2O-1]WOV85856.1 polyphosphate polymerase domain-containing protein [Sporosarcina sp. B2O-1]
MTFQNKKLRNELKFYLHIHEYLSLRAKTSAMLELDRHSLSESGYSIRSLYFDGMHAHSLHDKNDGIFSREKYRIRVYNGSKDVINLERKNKYGIYVNKESAPLTLRQYEEILKGEYDSLRGTGYPLIDEFHRALAYRNFRPSAITDYEREAYIYGPGNVRITFDKRLAAGVNTTDVFSDSLILEEVLPVEETVLEVKYDEYLPTQIQQLVEVNQFVRSAISKFVICKEAGMLHFKE